jgi:hypothetical protein
MWYMTTRGCNMKTAIATLGVLGVLATGVVHSEGFEGGLGVQQSLYTEESGTELSFGGKIGHSRLPVYLWGSYENPSVKILGQPMGDTEMFSVGIGSSREIAEGLSLFVETGYVFPSISQNVEVVDEVVYTWLVNRHSAGGNRNVPVPCAYNPGCYDASYEIEAGVTAKIGASWKIMKHLSLSAAYKWTYLNQEMILSNEKVLDRTEGYWREDETLNMSAFEVGIWYTF